jgi:hypothetical protein
MTIGGTTSRFLISSSSVPRREGLTKASDLPALDTLQEVLESESIEGDNGSAVEERDVGNNHEGIDMEHGKNTTDDVSRLRLAVVALEGGRRVVVVGRLET